MKFPCWYPTLQNKPFPPVGVPTLRPRVRPGDSLGSPILRRGFVKIVFLFVAFAFVPLSEGKRRTAAEELDFANALVDMGFKDYADKVVQAIGDKGEKELVELYECNVLVRKGEFKEAEEILKASKAGLPAYKQLTRLALAYYGRGDLKKSGELYDYVFTRYKEPPDDERERQFYLDAAYIYSTIMERAGDDPNSLKALDRVIAANTNEVVGRQLLTKKATLHLNIADRQKRKDNTAGMEKNVAAAKEITKDLFKVPDMFFAEGVSVLVRSERLNGRNDRALELINDYTDMVVDIEDIMVQSGNPISMSPMPALRYQKGDIYMEMSKAAKNRKEAAQFLEKGYEEYLNTFAKYKGNEWSDKSAVKLFEVSAWAKEKLGIQIEPEGGRDRTVLLMLETADIKFKGKDFKGAGDTYEQVLKIVPEGNAKVAEALVNLALCRVRDREKGTPAPFDLDTRAAVRQLAYRFRKFPEAGDSVLRLAGSFFSEGKEPLYYEALQVFAENFPNHVKASEKLFILGSKALETSKDKGVGSKVRETAKKDALRMFKKVSDERYKDDQWYGPALDQLGAVYTTNGDFAGAQAVYAKIIQNAPHGMERARAMRNYAGVQLSLSNYVGGASTLDRLLNDFDNQPVYRQATVKSDVRTITEEVYFMKGAALAQEGNALDTQRREANRAEFIRLVKEEKMEKSVAREQVEKASPPSPAVVEKWEGAMKAWERQLQKFSRDEQQYAPKALEGQGQIYMAMNDKRSALDKFKEIGRTYKGSPEARRVLYAMVQKSLELGMEDVAEDAVNAMLQSPEDYTPLQLLDIGRACNENGLFTQGNLLMNQVVNSEEVKKNPNTHQHVLMAQVTSANHSDKPEEAVKFGEALLSQYPKTGFKFRVKDELSKAYRAKKDYDNAISNISFVFKNAGTNKTVRLRALCELSSIQWEKGGTLAGEEQEKMRKRAISTYRFLIMNNDAPGESVEAIVREALVKGVERSKIMSQYGVGASLAERYLRWYNNVPDGEDPFTFQNLNTPSDTQTVIKDLEICNAELEK